MNDNVRKIFDMLGVKPNEEFKILLGNNIEFSFICKFDEKLQGYYFDDFWQYFDELIKNLLNGSNTIIKLPKKKKLRDLTPEEWDKWQNNKCGYISCDNCLFKKVRCNESKYNSSWINNKDIYSDKFLDQEIEVE